MSFRGRGDSGGNPNKMELGEPRKFGGPDNDKSNRDDSDRFDTGRGRSGRPPFGRGGRPSPGRDKPFNDRPRDFGYGRDEPMMRDRSPLRGPDDRFSDKFRKDDSFPKRDDHGRKDSGRSFFGDESPRDRFMDSRSRHEVGSGGGGSGNYGSRFDGPPSSMQYKPRPMNYPTAAKPSFFNEGFPKPNECEIIVVNKQQRAYAESVEDRVKALGILVDILFLKDEALLTQTIDDIARRGSLYAMVISPQNETHGSVTVNILHGTPQEHRNMPLEDALKLLSRNFHEHIRSQREHMDRERAERGQYIGGVVADREMQFLLRMLADGRWISLSEINLVIRYLSERRDKMQATGGDDRGPSRMPIPPVDVKMEPPFKPKDDTDVSQKEQDLQNRIINLMNQGAPPTTAGAAPGLGLNQGLSELDMPPPRQNQPPNLSNMRPPTGVGSGVKSGRPGLDENLPGPQGLNASAQNKDPVNKPVFSSVSNAALPSDPASTATYINFDNPSVQKALDNLIQSGPNILKSISLSASGVTNTPSNQPSAAPVGDNSGITAPNDHLLPRGNMGPRGSDIGGNMPPRNSGNLDMGPRGHNVGDVGGAGGPRNAGNLSGMGGMGPGRGGYGGNMPDMGHMNNPRGFGGSGMSDMGRMGPPRGGMGPPQGQEHGPPRGGMGPPQGQDLGPPQGMGQGGNFSNQNQYNKFQGPGQQGNFPYNSGPGMGGMSRQNYGGPQGMGGMGGGPRRY